MSACFFRKIGYAIVLFFFACGTGMGEKVYLDDYISNKPLGCTWNESTTIFRVFAPRALCVNLEMFDDYRAESGQFYKMDRDKDGVWEFALERHFFGRYYGYKIDGPIR